MNDISSERPASQATCSSPTGQAPSDLAATRHDQAQGLLALAASCEIASTPDRELDALIGAARAGHAVQWHGNDLREQVAGEWRSIGHIDPGVTQRNFTAYSSDLPFYTASLDAAMTLVPEGWRVDFLQQMLDEEYWNAGLYRRVAKRQINRDHASGATPALALCAAALRARASR